MAVALLLAAGRGERLGSGGPKALVPLAGRPLLDWSLRALRASPQIERIVVALPEGVVLPAGDAAAGEEQAGAGFPPVVSVTGGAERSHSVRAALAAVPDAEVVLVHDAARPLLTPDLVAACVDALGSGPGWDAAIAAAPVTDTVKRVEDGVAVAETLKRSELWAVQTPQVFRGAALARALERPDDELAAATDDAMLVEAGGGRVRVVAAPADNIKVTTAADLALAELLLAGRAGGGAAA
jgi:2-C-methyl-D-erythritol 4-phosphate cytidylyltransferase